MSNQTRYSSWIQKLFPFRTIHEGPFLVEKQPVAASQEITRGDPVTISGGELSIATGSSGAIYGVAAEDVTTTEDDEKTPCLVWVADRSTIFIGVADAATSGIDDGAVCDIQVSSGKWTLNIGTSTESVVRVIQHVSGDDTSDSTYPGRLEFIWERSLYDNLVAALG